MKAIRMCAARSGSAAPLACDSQHDRIGSGQFAIRAHVSGAADPACDGALADGMHVAKKSEGLPAKGDRK